MKVTVVSVECHEKRNHPTGEYSHFDSRVSLTAELDEGENPEIAVAHLQFQARQQVAIECDRWVNDILTEKARNDARTSLRYIIGRAEHGNVNDDDGERLEDSLAVLPESEQAEYRAKLAAAQVKGREYVEALLKRFVILASMGRLGWDDEDRFASYIADLPDDEATAWEVKMAEAKAAHEQSQAPVDGAQ